MIGGFIERIIRRDYEPDRVNMNADGLMNMNGGVTMWQTDIQRALEIYFKQHPHGCIWKVENNFIYPDNCNPEARISFRELFDSES